MNKLNQIFKNLSEEYEKQINEFVIYGNDPSLVLGIGSRSIVFDAGNDKALKITVTGEDHDVKTVSKKITKLKQAGVNIQQIYDVQKLNMFRLEIDSLKNCVWQIKEATTKEETTIAHKLLLEKLENLSDLQETSVADTLVITIEKISGEDIFSTCTRQYADCKMIGECLPYQDIYIEHQNIDKPNNYLNKFLNCHQISAVEAARKFANCQMDKFLNVQARHINKLILDAIKIQNAGIGIDYNPHNILYDKNKGFGFIDLDVTTYVPKIFEEKANILSCIVLKPFLDNINMPEYIVTKDLSKKQLECLFKIFKGAAYACRDASKDEKDMANYIYDVIKLKTQELLNCYSYGIPSPVQKQYQNRIKEIDQVPNSVMPSKNS